MAFVLLRLVCVICVILSHRCLIAADVLDEARALIHVAQHREAEVLRGTQWRWLVEKGKCWSIENGIAGRFDKQHPVDRYKCRWLSNDNVSLYESIAQQERRALERDARQHVIVTTNGSEQFLTTRNTRLSYMPDLASEWKGVIENRAHGLSPGWGPGGIPVHGGTFGLGRIGMLLDNLIEPGNQVTLNDKVSLSGIKSRVLTINRKDGNNVDYYFSIPDFVLVQYNHRKKGKLLTQAIVIETQTGARDGKDVVQLPRVAVMLHSPASDGSWNLSRITSESLTMDPAPLAEMVVPVDTEQLVLNPMGRRQPAQFVHEMTPKNLDEIAGKLFSDMDRDHAFRATRKKQQTRHPEGRGRLYLLLGMNLAAAVCLGVLYVYRRR